MPEKMFVTSEIIRKAAKHFADSYLNRNSVLYGVPRGGIPCALAAASCCGCKAADRLTYDVTHIIDDIWDSGATERRYKALAPSVPFTALFDKRNDPWSGRWLVMPWELDENTNDTSAHDAVTRLLQHIGEDPNRDGLKDTPARVISAWSEWASGYGKDPKAILKTFEEPRADEMIVVHNIPIVSKCEHHLSDIIGSAHVGYVPDKRIIGLSKIPRLVDVFARRLQVQERLTYQIADALMEGLRPLGVGVLIRASHGCMSTRGIHIHGSTTTTSAMRGVLLDKPEARAEFLALCRDADSVRRHP